jgi:hypothetical protein
MSAMWGRYIASPGKSDARPPELWIGTMPGHDVVACRSELAPVTAQHCLRGPAHYPADTAACSAQPLVQAVNLPGLGRQAREHTAGDSRTIVETRV